MEGQRVQHCEQLEPRVRPNLATRVPHTHAHSSLYPQIPVQGLLETKDTHRS